MYLKKAELENFGKFHHKTVTFAPGLNVVYGENESGKSTLHSFLTVMLFGLEKQRGRRAGAGEYQRYEPWNAASYYAGSLEFSVAGKDFTIQRNFYHREKTARLFNRQDGEELSVEHGDLKMLLGDVARGFYENTFCIAQAAVACQESFGRELNRELASRVHGGESGVDVDSALQALYRKQRQTEQLQKRCREQKEERARRLQWEQERLQEELEQKRAGLAALETEQQRDGAAGRPVQAEARTEGREQQRGGAEEAADSGKKERREEAADSGKKGQREEAKKRPAGLLWRLPVIGWILKLFWRLLHRKKGRAGKAGEGSMGSAAGKAGEGSMGSAAGKAGEGNMGSASGKAVEGPWEEARRLQAALAARAAALKEQLQETESRLLNVQEELDEMLGLTPRERELETELKSIRLAREVLEQAALESYQAGREDIEAAVSEIFSGVTGGKYDRLEVTEEGEVFLYAVEEAPGDAGALRERGPGAGHDPARRDAWHKTGQERQPDAWGEAGHERRLRPWQLSRGTTEQLYFALRLGAGRCLTEEEPLPVLLDETFCAYDDQRLRRTLRWLADQREQILLFTCQKREMRLLEELGIPYHRILLSEV